MKAILTGVAFAILLAGTAAYVLDSEFQRSAEQRYQTEAVRL